MMVAAAAPKPAAPTAQQSDVFVQETPAKKPSASGAFLSFQAVPPTPPLASHGGNPS